MTISFVRALDCCLYILIPFNLVLVRGKEGQGSNHSGAHPSLVSRLWTRLKKNLSFFFFFQMNASKQEKHSITIMENGKLNAWTKQCMFRQWSKEQIRHKSIRLPNTRLELSGNHCTTSCCWLFLVCFAPCWFWSVFRFLQKMERESASVPPLWSRSAFIC